ncbi:MAG: UPF0280 family protein [Syntrophomonadaceae bacterium]|jgi:ApbE superfamily uncharacterized protein (UPF0280 family)
MNKQQNYVNRTYRILQQADNLHYFNIKIKESDLAIGVDLPSYSDSLIPLCQRELLHQRRELEEYIKKHKEFMYSLEPIKLYSGAPAIAREMASAAKRAGVGPMASVAGAIAQKIGIVLSKRCKEYIIENGGDIYIRTENPRSIGIFAGSSPYSYKIAIRICADEGGLGICTSSGTVGPSLSFGQADAVVIKASNAALADAVATGAANRVKDEKDLINAIDYVKNIREVTGILAIKNDKMAAWGNMEIEPWGGRT